MQVKVENLVFGFVRICRDFSPVPECLSTSLHKSVVGSECSKLQTNIKADWLILVRLRGAMPPEIAYLKSNQL